MMIVLWMIETL